MSPFRIPAWYADGRVRALIGGVVWLVALLIILPHPFDLAWGQALLLLAPLVLLPLGLELTATESTLDWLNRTQQVVTVVQLPAAVLLGCAYLLPQGFPAAGLALPWLLTTGLIALVGLGRLWESGLKPLDEVCRNAGLAFVAVGGAWAVSDRLGFRPLDFEAVIVLLTAIHFHYAGFVLPVATGLAMRQTKGWTANVTGVGVIAGVPLVAVGITVTQLELGPLTECLAAWWLALSGMSAAWLHLRLAVLPNWPALVRSLWAVCGLSLFGSMVLAALYGTRFYLPLAWLDIPWMRVLHGTANALGFGVASLLAWRLSCRRRASCN